MLRFTIMSRLGLAEPLVRLARSIEGSNRRAAQKPVEASLPKLTLDAQPR
ncbi:MAG TPA: hypothetical protein VNP89_12700 [Gaiellaceae bacterium]|nr:hypothetical protein [Gaiellaceae bacterium]